MRRNIILTGMPGSGKSTIGRGLARELNIGFVDTDDVIEQQQGMSLTEIISNHGVEYFNDAEIRAAKSIKAAGLIVATGGSMVLQAESMTYLRSTGKVIFLDVDSSQLEIRLGPDRLERIIGLNEGGLAGLQERRRPFYESTCDVAIKLNGNDAEEDFQKVFTVIQDII